MKPIALPLAHFRAEWYQAFGLRRGALTNLIDAVLTCPRVTSPVALSLEPVFARGWSSVSDALSDGRIDPAMLRRTVLAWLPPSDGRPLWAIDGSTWPRPAAKTSRERTLCRVTVRGPADQTIVPGWEYQWVMAIPETTGSWVLPLDVRRRSPTAGTPTTLAIAQLRDLLAQAAPTRLRPVVVLDSHYDVAGLVAAVPEVEVVARLASNRRFYRRPPSPGRATGRPRRHGAVFRCAVPATQHDPDHCQTWEDPRYGTVTATAWCDLHRQGAATTPLTVIRITVARLPRRPTPPVPLWLCWSGATLPDLQLLWGWYQRRFIIEHGFRLLKQDLGWTTPRLTDPDRADRWSWLLILVLWHLWLARSLVASGHRPWERGPSSAHPLTPGQVHRAMGGVLAICGSPARDPTPRGKPTGRRHGHGPGPRPRCPPHVRTPKPAT